MKAFLGWQYGCEWIALNDEPVEEDIDMISGFISTLLLADCCQRDPRELAEYISKLRKGEIKYQKIDVPDIY